MTKQVNEQHCHPGHSGTSSVSSWRTSASATLHCLTGCAIGEFAGLLIGTSLGLPTAYTITLAVILAYISGMTLGLLPVMRQRKIGPLPALKIIWLGEVISIGVMEIAMNVTDYSLGGMDVTVSHPLFWISFAAAMVAGFLCAWPVNWWLLKRDLKACH